MSARALGVRPARPARWIAGCLLAGSWGAGCEGAPEAGAGFERTDSAGIAIATSVGPAWTAGAEWALSEGPLAILGGDGDEDGLWQVRGLVRADDGTTAVLSGGHSVVRVFDASGEISHSFGREGPGPREFERPFSLALLHPDTVLVLDASGLEVFLLDGTWVETRAFDPESMSIGPGTRARPLWLGPGGAMLGTAFRGSGPMDGIYRPEQGMAAFPSPDGPPTLLGWYGGIEQERIDVGGGAVRSIVAPFARETMGALGPLPDSRFLVGDNASYEIHVFDSEGAPTRIIRLERGPRMVEDEWIEAWKEAQRDMDWTRGQLPQLERGWLEMTVGETLPAFQAIVVDALGYVWVQRPTGDPSERAVFDIFDPDGRFLGGVAAPDGYRSGGARAPVIGNDFFMSVWQGALGIETVRVYALDRGRTGGAAATRPAPRPGGSTRRGS